MDMKPGSRLRSSVCSTEVIITRPAGGPVELRCGGVPMVSASDGPGAAAVDPAAFDPAYGNGTLLGKRYVHGGSGLELLCTKQGTGSLSIGLEALELKDSKPLPSSD